jgi:hypothetical protein
LGINQTYTHFPSDDTCIIAFLKTCVLRRHLKSLRNLYSLFVSEHFFAMDAGFISQENRKQTPNLQLL